MNMKVTRIGEDTDEDNIFNLVVGGKAEAYATEME